MSDRDIKFSRRAILRLAALGLGSAFLAACQRVLEPGENVATSTPSFARIVDGVPITRSADFYSVSYSSVPAIPSNWKLNIAGLVDKPLTFTLDEIKTMPSVAEMRTLSCISNPIGGNLISNAIWKGVRLKELLAQAGVKAGTQFLKLESLDNWSTGIPLELGMDDHALLVYEMNGEPLPREHGAPLRCLFPGRYGMKQPKWIQTITVIQEPYAGYWEKQGWSFDARILPFSRIDMPRDLAEIAGSTMTVSGIAFTDESGLAKLEISWDDTNQWQPAELMRGPSPLTWSTWKWTGSALSPGRHVLYARATDGHGKIQVRPQGFSLFGDTFPNGTDAMHSIVLDFKT